MFGLSIFISFANKERMAFTGTQQKCTACGKTVYVVDMLSADGAAYHKSCFKCSHCKGILAMSNYSSIDGVLYCKPHFEQLFKESGSFRKKFPSSQNSQKPNEMVNVEGQSYHKTCFKCSRGGCSLTPSNYAALDGILYCKHHFAQLFKEKGSYSHVTNATKRNVAQVLEAGVEVGVEAVAVIAASETDEQQNEYQMQPQA
ncbi:hypothetical protein Syun_012815 [Stephania yunnanensis]|uniref:LIM zinc-binding domain-containing protein n=1 Tax=Stephania yunnanensis TaxID=152371 RepID=A0AAP0K2C3_9MAGN